MLFYKNIHDSFCCNIIDNAVNKNIHYLFYIIVNAVV